MMKFWDPILAILCFAWCTALFLIAEPEPIIDWRVAAAFLQAILSAGAIFTAWWLQNQKRQRDRAEQVADNTVALLQHADAFEWTLGRAVLAVRSGTYPASQLFLYKPALDWSLEALRQVPVGHMPTEAAVRDLVALQHSAHLAISMIDWAMTSVNGVPNKTLLDTVWGPFFANHTRLLSTLGQQPKNVRSDPPKPRSIQDSLAASPM